jgi:hypothetical protein
MRSNSTINFTLGILRDPFVMAEFAELALNISISLIYVKPW